MNFYLSEIKNIESLKQLLIEKWNWQSAFRSINLSNKDFGDFFIEQSLILAERLNYNFIFFEVKFKNQIINERLLKIIERKIILSSDEIKRFLNYSVFIFSFNNFEYLDFIRPEFKGRNVSIKRFSINPENRNKLRTPQEQLEKLKIEIDKISYSYIDNKINEAFSVEIVTDEFYKKYIEILNKVRDCFSKQKIEEEIKDQNKKITQASHQFLNRLMFIYFIQKRGCFSGDKNFLANYWDFYKLKYRNQNEFHKIWLNQLFFESLSKAKKDYKNIDKLEGFNEVLKNAPFLNGGLFEKNEEDQIGWFVTDDLFEEIFKFFEGYNFTIEEWTPFDIDIAVNPEMIGNVYEHIVNFEESESREKAGIFYTPKIEIDFMLKRALVDFLFNKTNIDKNKIYKFIFPEIDEQVENPFSKEESTKILEELENIFILDPACGSGHYLVVASQILYDLKEKLYQQLNINIENKYEAKKKIIEKNIYGNDIKPWAVNIAKLRLWLDLFADIPDKDLYSQDKPLLPNLNFKIRCGDSLIQIIGNELLALRKISSLFNKEKSLIPLLKEIQKKKIAVYEDKERYKNVIYLENKLLKNFLSLEIINKQKKLQELNVKKIKLNIGKDSLNQEVDNEEKDLIKEKEKVEKEFKNLKEIESLITKLKEPPMIWDLAFAEVFQMKRGFDIVIANPPYVRQEQIEDLNNFYSKNEYKQKLIQQTKLDWSYDYNGKLKYFLDSNRHPIPQNFEKRSDLYVYFYLKGLKLLNPDGVLCYISSNSWLDVGFGRVLQEVLLKTSPIIAIYDNMVKRSFRHADVNTIIALIKAPKMENFDNEVKNNTVRFVNFKKPFEEIMYSEIFIELEKDGDFKKFEEGERKETEIYRIHKINQYELYELGRKDINQEENSLFKSKSKGEYVGNKWGGKYLRAPEIYWIILEKGKGKLVRLGDIAEVRFGIKTGANEFFYVEDVTDKIQDE